MWSAIFDSGCAVAAQWYIEPSVDLEGFYDDNVRLREIDAQSSFGAIARADVAAGRRTEVSDIAIDAALIRRQFIDLSELNTTDGFLGLDTAYEIERNRFGLDARLVYDSTLTSETGTSGLVQVNKRRKRLFLAPSWTYSLSDRSTLEMSASYADVSYEDVDIIPLVDYIFATVNVESTFLLDERMQLIARLSYDRYDADQTATKSDNFGILGGVAYEISETLSLTALAGGRHSAADVPTPGDDVDRVTDTGPVLNLSVEKAFEVGRLLAEIRRSLVPSSTGTLLDTTAISVVLDYPISARWRFRFDARGFRNRTPGSEKTFSDRRYVSLAPRIEYRLSEWSRLEAGYRYRWQERDVLDDDAKSNAVFVGFNYVWPRERLAR